MCCGSRCWWRGLPFPHGIQTHQTLYQCSFYKTTKHFQLLVLIRHVGNTSDATPAALTHSTVHPFGPNIQNMSKENFPPSSHSRADPELQNRQPAWLWARCDSSLVLFCLNNFIPTFLLSGFLIFELLSQRIQHLKTKYDFPLISFGFHWPTFSSLTDLSSGN